MLKLSEWIKVQKRIKKKKEKGHEPRGNQANRESGNNNQQGETVGGHPQDHQQTVHLFPIPEL